MRLSSIITVLLAVMLAGAAGYLAQQWLEQQRRLGTSVVARGPRSTIVVAARPLRFGTELTRVNLQEIEWPSEALPPGAFARISDVLKEGDRRLALAPIEPNEPVLGAKITGPGQRATLSSLISPGMKAITIRVNDVNGVAGFVLPGDRIDVMLTRKVTNAVDNPLGTEVLLQDVRVLGIDQIADERADKARVVRAVTVEVSIEDAQRVVLASTVGTLSLALRAAGATGHDSTGRVTPADLTGGSRPTPAPAPAPAPEPATAAEASAPAVVEPPAPPESTTRPFGVTRSMKRYEYSVPIEPNRSPRPRVADEPARPVPRREQKKSVPRGNVPENRALGTTPQSWLNSWSVQTIPNSTAQR